MNMRMIKRRSLLIIFHLISFIGFSQPVADFSAITTTICVGGSVQFTNLSSGAVNYNWTFPDGGVGQTSTALNPLITYSTAGNFTVVLTAVASNSVSSTETKNAYITVLASASATLKTAPTTNNQRLCLGEPLDTIRYTLIGAQGATFSGLPPGVSGSVVSDTSGGTLTIAGTPSMSGIYAYSFTTTSNSCSPITVNDTITVDASPTISLTSGNASQIVCVILLQLPLTIQLEEQQIQHPLLACLPE